jgi:dTDP-4-dehydrorhamnose 3,5-epimerase
MEFRTFEIEGPIEVVPRKIEDERGYFSEIFRLEPFFERAGSVVFVQDNQSLSARIGTIRRPGEAGSLPFGLRPRRGGRPSPGFTDFRTIDLGRAHA